MNREKPPVAADQTVFTERGPLCLPKDLRQWVEQETLLKWISEEADTLQENPPSDAELVALDPKSRPRAFLELLVFAYATQNFVSEDICRSCCSDKTYKSLCRNAPPFKQELQHFRRKNRKLLESALSEVLMRAVKQRYSKLGKLAPGVEYSLRCRVVDRVDTAVLMDRWEE